MAAAMTMQPPGIRPRPIPLSISPTNTPRLHPGSRPAQSHTYKLAEGADKEGRWNQCDGCRKRNSRCAINLAANKCYSCEFHRQDCIFTPNTSRKRSYPQSWDIAGKKSFHASSKSLSSSFKDLLQSSMIVGGEHDISNGNALPAESAEDGSSYRYVRGTTQLDPLLLRHVPLDDRNEASLRSGKFRKIGRDPGEFVEVLEPQITSDAGSSNVSVWLLETLSLADLDFLVQSFFHVVHPAFPILNQRTFLVSYENRSIDPLLLAAVCVVSGAWLSTTQRMPKGINLSNADIMLWEHLRLSLDQPSIIAVQAGLLLLQCPTITSQQLPTQLISIAFDLGLHRDCSDWDIATQDKSSRKRLAWALYAQDKCTALMHGRPAQITEVNWMVKNLTHDDFDIFSGADDKSHSFRRHCALLFGQMLVLSQLLAEILGTFYTLSAEEEIRASARNGLSLVLARAKPIQIKLKDWFSGLSAEMRMDAEDAGQAAYNGILHLAYFATEIALHRCIIRASMAPGTDSYIAHICRSAAKTRLISAMDFVNRLRSSHFKSAWPLTSIFNFGLIGSFGVLLRATAPTQEEEAFYRARLEEYRWTLAVSSRGADFIDSAIHLLDTGTDLFQYVPEKPGIAEFVAMNPHVLEARGPPSTAQASPFSTAQERSSEAFAGFSSPATSTGTDQDFEATEST